MTFLLPFDLKRVLFVCLLFISVCRAQIDMYSANEFITVAPNATVCSSTNILGDINTHNQTFEWTIDANNYVNWTLQGLFYPVLGSIQCPRGQGLIFEGVWRCNTDVSKTGDALAALSCPPELNMPTFGPAGAVFCDADDDTLGHLTCPSGSILRSNGSAWFCSTDANYLAGVSNCQTNDVLRYINGTWQCAKPITDSDILKSLIPTCTNQFIPKFIGGAWVCALDEDVLRYLNCATGARVQRSTDGTHWVCGPKEQDTFRDLTINCTGLNDTPFFTAENGWDCRPTPAINNSLLLGTILYEWSTILQTAGSSTASPSSQNQPYLVPYDGKIRGFQLKVSTIGKANMTASLFLNGARIYTTSFFGTVSGVVGTADLALPISANSNVSYSLTSAGPGGGYCNLGVYVQVLAV